MTDKEKLEKIIKAFHYAVDHPWLYGEAVENYCLEMLITLDEPLDKQPEV